MDCEAARDRLLDDVQGRLSPRERAELEAHVAACDACRRAREIERVTGDMIARIPRFDAPAARKRELRARYADGAAAAPPAARWTGFAMGALATALVASVALLIARPRGPDPRAAAEARLESELVNDHLRILYAEHPLDVASSGPHDDVKAWFAGKLDFAPPVTYAGDADFTVEGGAVAYVLDRRAAAFVFRRRQHRITVLVAPAEGLALPAGDVAIGARARGHASESRGFHLLAWRDGELAYAVVSDLESAELAELAARVAGP